MDWTSRLQRCSPQQRELLERLLAREGLRLPDAAAAAPGAVPQSASGAAPAAPPPDVAGTRAGQGEPSLLDMLHHEPEAPWKARVARFYDGYHQQCNHSVFGDLSFFMNLGYLPGPQPRFAAVELPRHAINRNSVTLVLELIGDCDLTGRDVLDVGCGRGGVIHVIRSHFQAGRAVGIDLSAGGVAYCRRRHRYPHTAFARADAERLPLAGGSVDVVTNCESSHNYPNITRFFAEVRRVLRTGGWFLYTDVHPVEEFRQHLRTLQDLGFAIERDRDITPNVLASCDQSAQLQFEAFGREGGDVDMANAIGVPGSKIYEDMRHGRTTYRIVKLRAAGPAGGKAGT